MLLPGIIKGGDMNHIEYKDNRTKHDKGKKWVYPDMELIEKYEPEVEMYSPSGDYLGRTNNYLVFQDWLMRIKLSHVRGYSVKFNGKVIMIDEQGTQNEYPDGMFDLFGNIMFNLI